MIFQILLILGLTALNAIFVIAEMAIVSVRESRLQELYEAGDKRAKYVLEMLKSPENFLSTIQTGVTLISILSGALGGATIAEDFAPYVAAFSSLAAHAEVISFALVVFVITYISLILGELVPKRWALSHAEPLALSLVVPLRGLMLISYPIVRLFTRSADIAMRVLRIPQSSEAPVSEQEIKIMLEHGERAGVVEESEKEMIERVFQFGDRRVASLMTHRTDIVWVDITAADRETWQKLADSGHSYFPVCREVIDEIVGIVSIKDLWIQLVEKGGIDLEGVVREPLIVPGTASASSVLERFKETKKHVALVVDEYGSLDGLVTVNDIVEAVVGDLPSLEQEYDPMIVERDDGSYLLDGALPYTDFEDLLDLPGIPAEKKGDFQTLAGFIISHLGRFPVTGERFEWEQFVFEIVDMDGHRVDRILVTPPSRNEQGDETLSAEDL